MTQKVDPLVANKKDSMATKNIKPYLDKFDHLKQQKSSENVQTVEDKNKNTKMEANRRVTFSDG